MSQVTPMGQFHKFTKNAEELKENIHKLDVSEKTKRILAESCAKAIEAEISRKIDTPRE